ncbi:MAG TPA: hypothetical protein VGI73_02545 [Solirubrobacterales bacterium]|jgi:hypothetical protein
MRKLNKGRTLAGLLAMAALLALAGSATASAAVWKDGGMEVTSPFALELGGGGQYEIEEGLGGVNCSEHMTLSSSGGSNATISKFENKSCKTFGTLAACTVQTVEAIGLPWSITLGTEAETISGMHVKHKFKAGCPVGEINETVNVTMTPDNSAAIESFELLESGGGYRQFGSYEIEGVNSGTYGIG